MISFSVQASISGVLNTLKKSILQYFAAIVGTLIVALKVPRLLTPSHKVSRELAKRRGKKIKRF